MLRLPGNTYDAVFFHQSLHHVARLERLLATVLGALKRDGLLYLDEYVGPSRTEWTFQKLRIHSAIFALLPEECRVKPELDLPIQPDDPSEAVRSGEIMKSLEIGFRIDQKRDYGGNLLSVLYPAINWADAPSGLLGRLIAAEEAVLATGEPSYHAVVVAKPATGVRAVAATAKYYMIRKMRGLRLRIEGMKSRS
jgi:SAM-dependent methyltransferase